MSTAAKTTLAGTVAGTIGIVYFVHRQQKLDKAVSYLFAVNDDQMIKRALLAEG